MSENTGRVEKLHFRLLCKKRFVKLMVIVAGAFISFFATGLIIFNLIMELQKTGSLEAFMEAMEISSVVGILLLVIECVLPLIVFILFMKSFFNLLPEYKAIKNKNFEIRILNSMYSREVSIKEQMQNSNKGFIKYQVSQEKPKEETKDGEDTEDTEDSEESEENQETKNFTNLEDLFEKKTYKVKFTSFEQQVEIYKEYEVENVEEYYVFYFNDGTLMTNSKNTHYLVYFKKQTELDNDLKSVVVE